MDLSRGIGEADWKVFRQLRVVALERFCERALSEVGRLAAEAGQTPHERYLAVFRLLERRDRELADAFNNPRRSAALWQLARIQSHGLLTEEEMGRFSPEVREAVQLLTGMRRD
jgi:hypothetical protein